jgi:ribosome-associated protein
MRPETDDSPEEADSGELPPSKSARKRAASEAQQLGELLIGLPDAELVPLALPEPLLQAIREARRIVSRSAGARQRQYIGRLMREVDTARIRALLEERSLRSAREAQRFRELEAWRERLLAQPAALDELERAHPGLERTAWQAAILAARAERDGARASGAGRTLFRMLRELLATMHP